MSKYFPQIVVDVNSEDVLSRKSNLLNDLASIDMVDKVYVQNKIQKQEYLAEIVK